MPGKNASPASKQARDQAARGKSLYDKGQYRAALIHFGEAVRLEPSSTEFHYLMALAGWRAGEAKFVEPHLLRAIELSPQHPSPHDMLGLWLIDQGQPERALRHTSAALALQPNHSEFIISHAQALIADGQYEQGADLLRRLVAAGSSIPRVAAAYGRAAPYVGREQEALSLIERALQLESLAPMSRCQLHFRAAELLDRLGRYDDAFNEARLANQGRDRQFDPAEHARNTSRSIEFFTADRLKGLPRATHGNRRPVFIVGMPRSGSSLVEQILASHPHVFGGGELDTVMEIVRSVVNPKSTSPGEYPESLARMSEADINGMASKYVDFITRLNATAPLFTDKALYNFRLLGTIELLLPQCRIIHCVRDPRDTCLSCYMTDFASFNEFTFNLDHLASFYRDYVRLMGHWRKVLSLPILDVVYEEVVGDLEGQARRIVEFLGLDWNENCLSFHKNKRYVATASRDQVRQPIYASSVGRWKNYEKHLGEVFSLHAT